MEGNVKQVIVIRRDLGMRRGKEIAQGAHASMMWLTRKVQAGRLSESALDGLTPQQREWAASQFAFSLSPAEREWVLGSFAKIVCQVPDGEALQEVLEKAQAAGLEAHAVIDAGRTEFHGQSTMTAIAIGPGDADAIDHVTGDLELY